MAFSIHQPGQAAMREVPAPLPAADEVLLRPLLVGLCGSDLSTWRGSNPMVSYPRIPGHEIVAEVVALGDSVAATQGQCGNHPISLGDIVVVVPYTACGLCPACRAGRSNSCRENQTLGVQRDGGMQALITIAADKLLHFPGMPLRHQVLVEPLSVGFHAVARAEVQPGETAVIIGCGAVGIGAVAAMGFTEVVLWPLMTPHNNGTTIFHD